MEQQIKILAIDDQQDNLDIIKAVMDFYLPNYKIFYAQSGYEGIQMAQTVIPDIILLDILMPGMDGFEVCEKLKQNKKTTQISIMMLSATGNKTETRIKGLEIGADAFLAKPYDPEELVAMLKILVRTIIAERDLKKERDNLQENIQLKTKAILSSKIELEKEIESKIKAEKKLIQAKEKAEVNEELINLFMNANQSPMFVKDEQYRYLLINDALAAFFGKSRKEILFKTDQELSDGKNIPCQSSDLKALNSKTRFMTEEQLDHRIYETTKFPLLMRGNRKGIGGIMRDVTDKKIAQKQLIESYNFNKQILNTIPFGMDIVDQDGNILFMNPIMKKSFGDFKLGDKCWKHYKDSKEQCEQCPLKKPIKIGETKNIVVKGINGAKTFEIIHTGMLFEGKNALMEIFIDISEKKIAENKLMDALAKAKESDQLKSTFLANLSHELRTPLNAVIGFSELIDRDLSMDDIIEYSQTINKSGNHLLGIIEGMFDITLLETGQLLFEKEKIKVTELLNEIKRQTINKYQLTQNKAVELHLVIPSNFSEFEFYSDKSRLTQILNHLLSNALKFTEEGTVHFGFSIEETKGAIKFFIKDTGIGIPEEKQKLIFEPFWQEEDTFTRNFGGVGIGLSLSKKLTELMGGKFDLESKNGEGSHFYFTFPLGLKGKKTQIEVLQNTNSTKISLKKKKILIVEDDENSSLLLEHTLKNLNYTTIRANNGLEAIKICKNNSDIDLILMDIHMPLLDGIEATKEIRKFNPHVPIIAQSAYTEIRDIEIAKLSGCNDYLSKPIIKNKLILLLNKYHLPTDI